jgi:putative oxidoreductase
MNSSSFQTWLDTHHDLFLDLIRVYLGTGLLVKGIYLMTHFDFLVNMIEQSGSFWFAPVVVAHYVYPAHVIGGILLALGLLTRFAALVQVPVLVGAIFHVYLPHVAQIEARQNFEFSALVLFLLLIFSVCGAGRWSMDAYLERRNRIPDSHAAGSSASATS